MYEYGFNVNMVIILDHSCNSLCILLLRTLLQIYGVNVITGHKLRQLGAAGT